MRKFLLLLSLFVIISTISSAAAADSNVAVTTYFTDSANTVELNAANYNCPINVILKLSNTGSAAATNATVNNTINPAQLQYDPTRPVQYSNGFSWSTVPLNGNAVNITSTQLTWNLGNLPSGATYLVSIPYIVKASGTTITNNATETQSNKNANPKAKQSGSLWTINSNNATLTVQKACNLTLIKRFTDNTGNAKKETWYGDEDLLTVLAVVNTGPDPANWVVVEDLINPLMWTIDFSKIQTSYDGGITWNTNDTNIYMVGNYLSWIVSPRKITQMEIAVPALRKPTLLNTGSLAMIKIPIKPAITGTPTILGTNLAGIMSNDETYSHDIAITAQHIGYTDIKIQRTADLSIVKSVSDNTPEAGDVITFTLTATSAEDINWIGNLVKAKVYDKIDPAYFKFINVTFNNVTNPTIPYKNNYTYDPQTGDFNWTIGNLDDGAWIEANITVQVLKDATTAAIDNTASITGYWQDTLPIENYTIHDLNPSNNQSTVTVNIIHTPTPPLTIVSTTPSEGTDYGLTQPVYITFNNTINPTGTGTVLIKNLTSGANISAPVITVSGSQLKIQFTKSRLNNNTYTITIPASTVIDQYGQKNTAFTLTFTAKS